MTDVSFEQFNELVAALYRGPFESPRWDSFLTQLSEHCAAHQSVLGLSRPRPNHPGVVFFNGQGQQDDRQAYGAISNLDPFVQLPDCTAMTMHELCSQAELDKTPYYTDFLSTRDSYYVLGTDIYHKDEVAIYIRVMRGKNCEDFGEANKALLNKLSAHFKNLVLWLEAQEKLNSEKIIYEGVASHLALGMVVINHNGEIEKVNPIAKFLLDGNEDLYIANNRLACKNPTLEKSLHAMLPPNASRATHRPRISESLAVPRRNFPTPLYLVIKPQVSSEFHSDSIHAHHIVFINASEMQVAGSQNALQQMLGLTKTESHIAIELANGLTVNEIADKTQVSVNTVRTHVARIYQKTSVNRQTAVVNLVLRCIASLD